jgi:hypothetical protein
MWAKALPFCLSAAGLLVPALPSRTWPAGPENADAKGTKIGDGKPEPIFSRSRSRPGASLCWAGLAVAGVLGCLPFAFMRAGPDVTLIAGFLLKFISFSLLAMAPLVCTFCGPVARRIVGALLALQVVGIMSSMRMMIHGKYQFWNLIVAFVLSAAGLLSMEVWQGKKARVFPEAGQPKVPLVDHSLE